MAAPSGAVTFLFTDIEGSTRLWQQDEAAMRAAPSRHDDLLRRAVGDEGGTVFSTMGDGMAVAFSSASSAVRAPLAGQRRWRQRCGRRRRRSGYGWACLPGNLPSLASSFVGRQEELAAVATELGAARLVTLTGVGDVGKTRLALQVAAEVSPRFADGAWVCELGAAANGDDMAQVVASALGVAQRAQMSLAESIVDFLRARHMLWSWTTVSTSWTPRRAWRR